MTVTGTKPGTSACACTSNAITPTNRALRNITPPTYFS